MSLATLPPAGRSMEIEDRSPSLQELLANLYRQQAAQNPANHYLQTHGTAPSIANHVRTFHWYRPYLPATGAILDWGCQHAPDSCLLRAWFGDRYQLHGCDFPEAQRHQAFHAFAKSKFATMLGDEPLPYASRSFDAVIGSGVLEHAACDGDALRELYRILRPGGILVITYLPNWLSINEWMRRVIWRRDFHHRLYSLGETRRMLKHHGFIPLAARHHSFLWERLCPPLAGLLRRLLPVQVFSSTLCLVARRVRCM